MTHLLNETPPKSFSYSSWRHGGWYVNNVEYPSGAIGCVSRNYDDGKWRIACDGRQFEKRPTFANRDEAARAEWHLAHMERITQAVQAIRNRLAVTGDYADTIRAAHAMLGNLIGEQNPVQPFEHWGNDPDHPVEDWRAEVASDETRLSYAEWLAVKREG